MILSSLVEPDNAKDPQPLPSQSRQRSADAERLERRREDDRLIARVKTGDFTGFEELYKRHSSFVFALLLRMLHNRADAEDLLQEIFLQAHGKLPSFEGRSAFRTWLYRLTVNRCLDHLRSRRSKEQARTDPMADFSDQLGVYHAASGTRSLELERAISLLPPSTRAAFLLHDVEGYDHREVGDILGIATGTSKSLVHRARMKLREALRPPSAGETQ